MSEKSLLETTLRHALTYLESLDTASVAHTATLEELRAKIHRPLTDEALDAEQVINDLVHDVEGGILGSAGGRFFGWVIGGATPASIAADWLTSVWDNNAGLYTCAPAEAVIEESCGEWLKELLCLPESASFALVTGCQMAHTTCLATARHALLERRGWDLQKDGLFGVPRIHVLSSTDFHDTILRSLRLLGLGTNSLHTIPSDNEGRLTAEGLTAAFEDIGDEPCIVLLQAGDLNIGAFDPFEELIPIAHAHNAWVHIDGAFGLWVNTSPSRRHFLKGVEQADSWATDGHKWLNLPYDCGYAFVAHPEAHHAAMAQKASYLTHKDDVRDQMDWTPDFSRRGRGFATYAAIRQMGRNGITDLIDRCCDHAHTLVTRIGALDGAELIWEPTINQGLVRFPSPKSDATEADHTAHTEAVIAGILETGEALFSSTTWRGIQCMRVSVSNWRTNDSDVDRAVAATKRVLSNNLAE
ncbi:MAG: aminotransferase class V-fold PLP-dependent enzyme [Candidatus Hydrogenedentota bacterium]